MRIPDLIRRPGTVWVLVLLVTLAALLPASRLRIHSDLVSLLPVGSPTADDYRVFLERFGGLEQVFVLIEPTAPTRSVDLAEAATLLEKILLASPEVKHVRAGLEERDEELFARWVAPRAPLLLGDHWRETVLRRIEPQAIARRVARLRASLSTPAGAFEAQWARSDPLGFTEELSLSTTPDGLALDPLTSTFRSPDGGAALVLVTPSRGEMDPEGGRALAAALDAAYSEVRHRLGEATGEGVGGELDFRAVGGPLYAAQDEALLRGDLQRTLTASLLTTTALLLVVFGGWRMPLTVVAPLLVGLVWTAAAIALVRGEISAVSIGFGAVLVGLGIDYGIHGATRFRQAYLANADAWSALRRTVRHVGPPILTSAVTTAVGFGVLSFAHLPPLKELGQLVTLGILAILGATAVAGGTGWVLVAPRLRTPEPFWRGLGWRGLGRVGDVLPELATRHPKLVLAAAAVAVLVAIPRIADLSLDADVRTLRPVDHPALAAEDRLVKRFGVGVDTATVAVPGEDLGAALAAARQVAEDLRRELPSGAVSTPSDFLARGEPVAARLRELAELPLERAAEDLERELAAANLNPRAFDRGLRALRALGRGEDPGAPPEEAWPEWLRRSVHRPEGRDRDWDRHGVWVAVRLRLPPGTWPDGPPPGLVERIRSVAPGAAIASAVALGAELRSLAAQDLRTLALLALVAVATVVTFSFRGRLGDSALAGLPVVLGSLGTLALWAALGRSLDLFSLAVFPILLGVGIDDGLHVVHGIRRGAGEGECRDEGRNQGRAPGLRASVGASARALTLTTLTTCVGFGSLMLSSIPGLRNGGALIAVGVLACWLATLLVLPAFDALRYGRSGRSGRSETRGVPS